MTIDPLFLNETSSIAYPENFYPADIEIKHHQLRNFISTFYHGKIFYVNRHDIYILDLETRERTLLVTVEFEARCLAAAHGWVCVGGEARGDCAFVHIGEHDGQPGDFCHDLHVKMIGKEIVNAMDIQVLKSDPTDAYAKDETVVLVSNNDHTVTLYSLCQRKILTTIDYPQPMNYATLSPDSTIMAAVGDENKIYFLKRTSVPTTPEAKPDLPYFPEHEWSNLAGPKIPPGSFHPDDFSFAIAFSPDGHLCAVSSQGGAITVFDMDAVVDQVQPAEDAIICTFPSSRDSIFGCVRSMAFSPAHWNILAWTEDHGRVGLADVRQGFQRRQHLHLSKEKIREVEVYDATPFELKSLNHKERMQLQRQQRQQALRGHPPVGARLLNDDRESSSISASRELDDLSQREQSVDAALEAALGESVRPPYSINYISHTEGAREYDVQLLNSSSRFTSSHLPRRRPSVVLSGSQSSQRLVVDESSRMTMTASPGPISDDGMPPPMSTNDLTPASSTNSSQPLPYNIPPSDPWHVIEANLASSRTQNSSSARQSTSLQRVESAILHERQLEDHMVRQLSDEQRLSNMLRQALDTREMLERVRQQAARTEQSPTGGPPPRAGQLLIRQLTQDLDQCQTRVEQLTGLLRNMPRRLNQLREEREALNRRHTSASAYDRVSPSSARSSALPTVPTWTDPTDIERRMQEIEEEREFLTRQIEEMEREVRRAENHIESTPFTIEFVQLQPRDRIRALASGRSEASLSILRLISGPQNPSADGSLDSWTVLDRSSVLEASGELSANSSTHRRTRARITVDGLRGSGGPQNMERTNRHSQTDMYTARLHLLRSNTDVNGNWQLRLNAGQSQAEHYASSIDEVLKEAGIGTAGIGWSPDGLKL